MELVLECFLQTLTWWTSSRHKLIPHMAITLITCWDVITISLTAVHFETLVYVCEERRGDILGSERHENQRTDQEEMERKISDWSVGFGQGEETSVGLRQLDVCLLFELFYVFQMNKIKSVCVCVCVRACVCVCACLCMHDCSSCTLALPDSINV